MKTPRSRTTPPIAEDYKAIAGAMEELAWERSIKSVHGDIDAPYSCAHCHSTGYVQSLSITFGPHRRASARWTVCPACGNPLALDVPAGAR